MSYVIAADIGATHARLVLASAADSADAAAKTLHETTLPSTAYASLPALLQAFLGGLPVELQGAQPQAYALGLPGPILDGALQTTNLPWRVATGELQAQLGAPVQLLNDLQALAIGSQLAGPTTRFTLQQGVRRNGNVAILAAGTGLGQALLVRDEHGLSPIATEGGHTDFAPESERDVRLWRSLRATHGHVSWERVVSGPGLTTLARFLIEVDGMQPSGATARALAAQGDAASAVLGPAGLSGSCPVAAEATQWLVRLWGAQAGNLALTSMALGGVLVAGGLAEHLLPLLQQGPFLSAFRAKGRMSGLLAQIPVEVLLDPQVGRLGALHVARSLL